MQFVFDTSAKPSEGHLLYRLSDHGLYFQYKHDLVSAKEVIFASSLSLDISTDGQLLGVSGFAPTQTWIKDSVNKPLYVRGAVYVRPEENKEIESGDSLPNLIHSQIICDEETGWLRVGAVGESRNVMFATNIVAGLSQGQLKCIWFNPQME